ncbi:peroxiredoxin [Myxosarcina sp. GI1]|uniref:peroxiredoxin n=1 Tax=Myxosarcina sp. GI1 TaxID=1541065 RepID=UPI00055B259C|nr:peroxiredoxin [Myxosarcina sp. GI1]
MSISVGDRVPSTNLSLLSSGEPEEISTDKLFSDKKVVLVAVTGAFTPACSNDHLPGFVRQAEQIKQHNIDAIACVSVNDPFVMDAWGKATNANDKIMMLADSDAKFTKAMGMEADMSDMGFGIRSQRYAAIVENGVVKELEVDKMGEVEASTAEKVLAKL